MTAGKAIVRSLRAHGVDTVFGLPGVQLDHLFNALYDEGNAIRVLQTRHEQGAGYMALGYAQASGRVGVFAVVPGPGLLNTTSALATAYGCYVPVLALSGQIPLHTIDRGYGLLHEVPDQLGLIRRLTKWAARIEHPTQASSCVREAFRQLASGVVRPVEVEAPMDVLGHEADIDILEPAAPDLPPACDLDGVEEAASLLAEAERPVIVCGGGAIDAGDAIREVAERLQAPVISNRMGRGVLDDRHYLSVHQTTGHKLWTSCDVALAVGTRFQAQKMVWGVDERLRVIRIDIDPTQMHRLGRPAVGIVADARQALVALAESLARCGHRRESREEELTALEAATKSELEAKLGPQMAFIEALRSALPEDGIFVNDLTQVGYVAHSMLPIYRPRSYITSGYQGTLGAGFATALGVKVAEPERPVLSVNGDGGFMYNVQELATAALHGIDVVTVVFDDGAFGNVKRMQEEQYGGRVIGSELRNPDFVRLAESFAIAAERAETPGDLGEAVKRAFDRAGPSLIEVPVGKMPDPWGVSHPFDRARPE